MGNTKYRKAIKGKIQCKICKKWKLRRFFYQQIDKRFKKRTYYRSLDCIECRIKKETSNYFIKAGSTIFMQMERARRKERYWRQQFEKFKKNFDENN